MRFRLSTVFLLTLTLAILLGWYVEHASRHRRDIAGTWYYPTNDLSVLGYTSLLEIRWDGTFTKIQGYRMHHETFDGTYTVEDNGRITFHVTSKTSTTILAPEVQPETEKLDAYYSCRCAIDLMGYLVIDADQRCPFADEKIGIKWETCARDTNCVIQGRKVQKSHAATQTDSE